MADDNVIPLRPRKRKIYVRGAARSILTEAINAVVDPVAIVIVAIGREEKYCLKYTIEDGSHLDFDALSRAEAMVADAKNSFIRGDGDE